jgi:hypothetical protein
METKQEIEKIHGQGDGVPRQCLSQICKEKHQLGLGNGIGYSKQVTFSWEIKSLLFL